MTETEEIHHFQVDLAWTGDALGSGRALVSEGDSIAFAGATVLGGSGGLANPEELLLTAVGSCFVNTWAIFLKKLALSYAEPTVRVSGELGKDPAGGFRMRKVVIHPRVPAALLSAQRPQVEKTLALAEKYCIISKVVRAGVPVEVAVEEV